MTDEDKTREQIITELVKLRKAEMRYRGRL